MRKKIKETLTNWRVGDYIRQLSVVTLGIIITFMGSDLISERHTQKRLETALQLVKSELILTRDAIESMKSQYDQETVAGLYLQKYKNQIEQANEDSLKISINIPFRTTHYQYNEDAIEMLKTSGLIHQIKNQELAIKLIKTNNIIKERAYGNFNVYADNKNKKQDILHENKTFTSQYNMLRESNSTPLEMCRVMLEYTEFEDLYRLPTYFLNSQQFLHSIEAIDQMIAQLDKEYEFENK